MIFDSHVHYDDKAFDEDRERLLDSLPSIGVGGAVNIGADKRSSENSIELAEKYDYIYAAVGIHPSDVMEYETGEASIDWLRQAATCKKVVAVGEIGLDYHWDEPEREIQKKWFRRQLLAAIELKKPIVIHSRDAAADTLDILKETGKDAVKAVMHCYSYEYEIAKRFLDMGCYIGIGGVLTFKNARKQVEVLKNMPLDRLLLETDCPYMAPAPHRGERNNSAFLPLVIEKMAEVRELPAEEIEKITFENALKFYEIS